MSFFRGMISFAQMNCALSMTKFTNKRKFEAQYYCLAEAFSRVYREFACIRNIHNWTRAN